MVDIVLTLTYDLDHINQQHMFKMPAKSYGIDLTDLRVKNITLDQNWQLKVHF